MGNARKAVDMAATGICLPKAVANISAMIRRGWGWKRAIWTAIQGGISFVAIRDYKRTKDAENQ